MNVSYLITTRNRAEYLERTLDNVRQYITKDDELIVIDGGSTDGTLAILERNRDVVSVVLSEPDRSEAHAFNKGWQRARGRYLKPITDDDYFDPDAMRQMIAVMDAHPEIDCLLAGGEIWHMEGGVPVFKGFFKLPPGTPPDSVRGFWKHHCGLGLLIRRTALDYSGGLAGNTTSADGELVSRIIACGLTYRYLDINLFRWCVYPHSGVNKNSAMQDDYRRFRWRLSDVEPWWCLPDDDECLWTMYLEGADAGVRATAKLMLWQMRGRRRLACTAIGVGARALCAIAYVSQRIWRALRSALRCFPRAKALLIRVFRSKAVRSAEPEDTWSGRLM